MCAVVLACTADRWLVKHTQRATGETGQEALEQNHFLFITTIHAREFAVVSERHCVGKEV